MRYFIGDGAPLVVTHLFDVNGDPTEDVSLARTFVAELPDGKFLAAECFDGEIVTAPVQ